MLGFLFGWMHMFCFLKSQPTKKAMKSQLDTLKVFMKLVAINQDLLRRSQHGLKQVSDQQLASKTAASDFHQVDMIC